MKNLSLPRIILMIMVSIIEIIVGSMIGFGGIIIFIFIIYTTTAIMKISSRSTSGLAKILLEVETYIASIIDQSSTSRESVRDVEYAQPRTNPSSFTSQTSQVPPHTSRTNSTSQYSKSSTPFIGSSTIMQHIKSISFSIVGLIILLSLVMSSYFIVQPGEVAFLVRFGNIQASTYDSGIFVKIPWVDKVVTINTQIQKNEAEANSASSDLQDISALVALNYSIDRGMAKDLYRTVGNEDTIQQRLISPAIQESVKAATAKYVASQLITDRVNVRADMVKLLTDKLQPHGIIVTDLNIIDFKFSAAFNQAIESKVRAEQDALAEKNKLEQIKYQAQQQIETAKAEAEKIKIQAEAITKQGGKEYVQLQWIEKRDGKLPKITTADNGGMLLQVSGDDL